MGDPYWPAFFLVQPVVALAIAVMIGKGLSLVFPHLLRMLNGGRPLHERPPHGTPSSIPAQRQLIRRPAPASSSEERPVGNECVLSCRSRLSPAHYNKTIN